MRHLIADAIGAPAQRQLGKIAGADHQRFVLVGEAKQIVGAQAGLNVLEGDVVDRLAAREGMVEVGQHLPCGRADVDLLAGDAERPDERPGVGLCLLSEVAKPGSV